MFLAQLLHETGECRVDPKTNRFWRVVGQEPGDSGLWNPAGIKRGDAEQMKQEPGQFETDTPAMFEKPKTPAEGARLGYNHKGAYFGLPTLPPQNGRYPLALSVAKAWRDKNGRWPVLISDWGNINAGGVWAGAPGTMYADATRRYLSEFARG